MKTIIGFDFDGVIANPIPAKIKLAGKLGFSILPNQTSSDILQKIIKKSSYKKLAFSLYREETLKYRPCPGVKNFIKQLFKKNTLIIISARGKEESVFAKKWLKKQNLLKFFDKIIFCKESEKPEFIKKNKINIYIDDNIEILNLCPKNITKILYNPHAIKYGNINHIEIKNFKNLTNKIGFFK